MTSTRTSAPLRAQPATRQILLHLACCMLHPVSCSTLQVAVACCSSKYYLFLESGSLKFFPLPADGSGSFGASACKPHLHRVRPPPPPPPSPHTHTHICSGTGLTPPTSARGTGLRALATSGEAAPPADRVLRMTMRSTRNPPPSPPSSSLHVRCCAAVWLRCIRTYRSLACDPFISSVAARSPSVVRCMLHLPRHRSTPYRAASRHCRTPRTVARHTS